MKNSKQKLTVATERKCGNCYISIEGRNRNAIFCSKKCRDADSYRKKPKVERLRGYRAKCEYGECPNSVWYFPRHILLGKRRFCSMECARLRLLTNTPKACTECGAEYYCSKSQAASRNRITCSLKCRSIRQIRLAEERRITNPPTTGALNRRIRYSKKMSMWRVAVFERDNYTCQMCFIRGGYLEADHIKQFAYYPELRLDINNGRTLCKPCHRKTPTYANKEKIS